MRVVVDTNVLVSALLKAGSVPDRAIAALLAAPSGTVLHDARMLLEYRTVLARPKFRAIPRPRIEALIGRLQAQGTDVGEVPVWTGPMNDDDDRLFVEVALAGHADAILTGNIKDYPSNLGFEVLPPASLLGQLDPGGY